ncbi:hypothetical protein B0H14DRAFT_3737489, partial [Mycena olivaceomarginata]
FRTSLPFLFPPLARGGPLQTTIQVSTFPAAAMIAVTCAISILRARSFARGRGDPPWVEPASHCSAPSSPLRLVAHAANVALCFIFWTANAAALTPASAHATRRTEGAVVDAETPTPSVAILAAQRAGVHRVAMVWVRRRYPRVCRSRSSAPIGGEVRGRSTAHADNPLS